MARLTEYDRLKTQAFSARLRKARIGAGCSSMDEGARRCKTVSSVYHRHEAGIIMATVPLIERYARGFGVSPCWLAFGVAAGAKQKPKLAPSWKRFARDRERDDAEG